MCPYTYLNVILPGYAIVIKETDYIIYIVQFQHHALTRKLLVINGSIILLFIYIILSYQSKFNFMRLVCVLDRI